MQGAIPMTLSVIVMVGLFTARFMIGLTIFPFLFELSLAWVTHRFLMALLVFLLLVSSVFVAIFMLAFIPISAVLLLGLSRWLTRLVIKIILLINRLTIKTWLRFICIVHISMLFGICRLSKHHFGLELSMLIPLVIINDYIKMR